MRLVSFLQKETVKTGVVDKSQTFVMPVEEILRNPKYNAMSCLIEVITVEERANLQQYANKISNGGSTEYLISEIKLLAPIPHPRHDIICLGFNYKAHLEEFDETFKLPEYPIVFSKRASVTSAHHEIVKGHLEVDEKLDYESELGIIIGEPCYKISREESYNHIFGYTIINDFSQRALQQNHQQWYLGKSADGFSSFGPWIVTADEFEDNHVFNVSSEVNGELRQQSTTDKLIFDIPEIVSTISRNITLLPGDIIATGTPEGVAKGFNPPKYLKRGDQVICMIDGIGELENVIG